MFPTCLCWGLEIGELGTGVREGSGFVAGVPWDHTKTVEMLGTYILARGWLVLTVRNGGNKTSAMGDVETRHKYPQLAVVGCGFEVDKRKERAEG